MYNNLHLVRYIRVIFKIILGDALVTVADCSQRYFNSQLKTYTKFKEFADYWENLIEKNYPLSETRLYLKVIIV